MGPDSPAVAAAEARRRAAGGRVVTAVLSARRSQVDLGGPVVATWTYGTTLPGPTLRATAGDVLRVTVRSELPQDTSVHWHGVALRNDMDGVPGVTQQPIRPGRAMVYEFTVPDPGTYWVTHCHNVYHAEAGMMVRLSYQD